MSNTATPLMPVDGTITITDGAALSLVVQYEDGNFSVSGLTGQDQKSLFAGKSRGKTYCVRKVEDENIEFGFSAHAVHIVGDGTTGTLGDVALKKGAWSSATSKLASTAGDAYLVQVSWRGERTNFGATQDNVITLKYCALTMDFAEGVPGTLTIKGTCFPISTDSLTIV